MQQKIYAALLNLSSIKPITTKIVIKYLVLMH
jgi:transketolase C-terminal domain/subunit